MGMQRAFAIWSVFNAQQQAAANQKKQQEANKKLANKYNESYSSGEFADNADAGSEFFNQTKNRGTLFGN